MNNRRSFFRKMLGMSTFFSLQALSQQAVAEDVVDSINTLHQLDLGQAVQNEDLWKRVQAAYSVSKSYINLNNGGVSPQPTIVQNSEKKYLEMINDLPSMYLSRVFPRNRSVLRAKLAKIGGCLPEEIAIMQNTTEAINTVVLGIDWKAGDEVVLSRQDYSTVKVGWEQLARRKKIKLVWVNLPSPIEDNDQIVEAYIAKFTQKTKFVNLTQIINWTGQILPVAAIARVCEKAREKNIFSHVDGAHSFAHINFKISELKCDAYSTSLHKWLSAPIGTGLLYVRKEQIPNIWSLFPSSEDQTNIIQKFEHKGTISLAREEATHTAIEFYNHIGIELKEARLRYLKNYWANQLKDNERIKFYTSFKDEYAGAIALFDINGGNYKLVSRALRDKYRIHHTNSVVEGAQGIRISPNVYTTIDDLDRLVEAVTFLVK
jgi:selenocysteine lyase/cysteine desulfurase